VNTWAIVILLPIVGAIIGYTTKWAAIQMLFKPARYIGVGPIGWQGVVQRRSPKFAAGIADTVTGSALDVHELVDGIEPAELTAVMSLAIEEAAPDLAATIAESLRPGAWQGLGPIERERAATAVARDTQLGITEAIEQVKPQLATTLDPRGLIVSLLSGENADRLARLVQDVAAAELRWVIRFGAVCGFAIGVVEAVVFLRFDRWWLLPLVGAFDGIVNNWLAILMMFRPLERTRYLGVVSYQGLFAARQAEIAANYARMMGEEVLTPRHLVERLAEQDSLAPLTAVALAAVQPRLENQVSAVADVLGVGVTDNERAGAVGALMPALMTTLAPLVDDVEQQVAKWLDITGILEQRLAAMDKAEFETVLRSIFQEDEWILIALGGVLGTAIGTLQAGLVLGTGIGG
jgi:uncharacterized membrane protein YheB (UPF0754 family)